LNSSVEFAKDWTGQQIGRDVSSLSMYYSVCFYITILFWFLFPSPLSCDWKCTGTRDDMTPIRRHYLQRYSSLPAFLIESSPLTLDLG